MDQTHVLVVDNHDSFTYNLVQILEEHGGCHVDVAKNDAISIPETGRYAGFVFSPGPGLPSGAPVMAGLLRAHCRTKSFLGICLGHQAIGEAFGMKLVRLSPVRHGTKARIQTINPPDLLFAGMPPAFDGGVYHSWAVSAGPKVPGTEPELRVTALSDDGVIMALAHTRYDIRGVQFHPESFMSENGRLIVGNWIEHLTSERRPHLPGPDAPE
jgi:anthranilate synthase component II